MAKAAVKRQEPPGSTECVAELARFFPGAQTLQVQVRISKTGKDIATEETIIESGTATEILFASELALDFDEIVQVRSVDGTINTTAKIVAMRFYRGKMAIAAEFQEAVAGWVIKA
jgi:hypothetical protein